MSKVCAYKGCGKELPENSHVNRKYCNITCRNREVRRLHPENDKKIEELRFKRSVKQGLVLEPTTPLVYENYKEPLRNVENGFGYLGVVAMNEERTHIQCHECGFFFKSLNAHSQTHGLSIPEYKEKYQLMKKTALIGDSERERRIKVYKNLSDAHHAGVKAMMEQHNADVKSGKVKKNYSTPKWSLEKRNIEGLCPDQLLEKITDLADIIGHTPTAKEMRKKYTRYTTAIINMFGTWNKAVAMAKLLPNQMNPQKYTTVELLQWLRDFYEQNNRVPTNSDFARGYLPGQTVYIKRFGNLNYARMEAGIPILIPLGGRRFVESLDYQQYKPKEPALTHV